VGRVLQGRFQPRPAVLALEGVFLDFLRTKGTFFGSHALGFHLATFFLYPLETFDLIISGFFGEEPCSAFYLLKV
jgi:hypothetical protein